MTESSTPLLSIIIPVYNAERILRRCVESIQRQPLTDYEIILIDDGSRDGSPALCDDLAQADNRIKVVHKANGGVSSARNRGLDIAQGEWLAFVDSDDWLADGFLQELSGHTEDILFGGYETYIGGIFRERFDTAAEFCGKSLAAVCGEACSKSIFRGPWSKFYKRALVDDLRFREDMKVGEDSCFVLSYVARCTTYATLSGSYYCVDAIELEESFDKYAVTVDYAVNSLAHLHAAFALMRDRHDISREPLLSFIGYFKRLSQPHWKPSPSRWWSNPDIMCHYRYIWPDLSLMQKIRLVMAFLLKR